MQSWDYDIWNLDYRLFFETKLICTSFASQTVIIITIINTIMMVLFSNQLVIVFGAFAQQRAPKYETTLLDE